MDFGDNESEATYGEDVTQSRSRSRRMLPRYSLRALLLFILFVAVMIPVCQLSWRSYIIHLENRNYTALQATKQAFVERQRRESSGNRSAVDHGRPVPDHYVVLVRKGNVFGCFIPREQGRAG